MDKTLDELLQCVETSGEYVKLTHDPLCHLPYRWAAGAITRDGGWDSVPGPTPLAALQALIVKARLPIVLHKQPER